jgi:hypothetical protein
MPFAAHRNDDPRICGATTTVQNQSSVFVNDKLWAVDDSHNSHGFGGLIPTGQTVYVENKLVICHTPDRARPDTLCPISPVHCDPATAGGSGDTFCY